MVRHPEVSKDLGHELVLDGSIERLARFFTFIYLFRMTDAYLKFKKEGCHSWL